MAVIIRNITRIEFFGFKTREKKDKIMLVSGSRILII